MTCIVQCNSSDNALSLGGRNLESHHGFSLFLSIYYRDGGSPCQNEVLLGSISSVYNKKIVIVNWLWTCHLEILWHIVRLGECNLRVACCHSIIKPTLSYTPLDLHFFPFFGKLFIVWWNYWIEIIKWIESLVSFFFFCHVGD
jgi:hypothetical protein